MNNTIVQESVGTVDCVCILKQELSLLEQLAETQEKLKNSVFSRDWTDLELLLGKLDEYGNEFKALERERIRIFSAMNKLYVTTQEADSFYSFASKLPPFDRKELTSLYRRLKLDSLKVRLANDTLMQYLNNARSTVSSFLEAAFPDRRGRMYSKRGMHVHSEMRSIVLDRSF